MIEGEDECVASESDECPTSEPIELIEDPAFSQDKRLFLKIAIEYFKEDKSDHPRVTFARDMAMVAIYERIARIFRADIPPIGDDRCKSIES